MDVFAFALRMEREGEAFYRRLAEVAPNEGYAAICTMLADEEVRHAQVVLELQRMQPVTAWMSTLTEDVHTVFARMIDSGQIPPSDLSQIQLYRRAQDLERQSREFYLEYDDFAGTIGVRVALTRLADEELRHWEILDAMIEFVSRPLPGNWLENAEWYQREAY